MTDGNRAYEAFAAAANITQIALVASAGERTTGCYYTQNVSAYQSRFKFWMARFKGVASKYLPSYLGWRRSIERDGGTITPRQCLAGAFG